MHVSQVLIIVFDFLVAKKISKFLLWEAEQVRLTDKTRECKDLQE